MKVIWFNGNLGNQVFYCKYKDYLQAKYPKEKVYAYIDRGCPPVRVDKVFNLTLPKQNSLVNIVSFFVFKFLGFFFRRCPINMVPKWYCTGRQLNSDAVFFGHSLQVKDYYCEDNSCWLVINKGSLPKGYLEYESLIKHSDSVCVHIRRGDYIKTNSAYVDLCSTDYYDKAISLAKKWLPNAKFFFFSDDLGYVKTRFPDNGYFYVDCNQGSNSYLDIALMSYAKINIIANSTFSYWGAYINHENKKVICPKMWFNDWTGRSRPDIMLSSWINI